jgi:hypothetical protein
LEYSGRGELITMFKKKGDCVNRLSILIFTDFVVYFKYHAFKGWTGSNLIKNCDRLMGIKIFMGLWLPTGVEETAKVDINFLNSKD